MNKDLHTYIIMHNVFGDQDEYFEHFGAKGMHWGQRRWQNEDGSLTPAGRVHYGYGDGRKNGTDTMTVQQIQGANNEKSHENDRIHKQNVKTGVKGTIKTAALIGSGHVLASGGRFAVGQAAGTIAGKIAGLCTAQQMASLLGTSVGSITAQSIGAMEAASVAGEVAAGIAAIGPIAAPVIAGAGAIAGGAAILKIVMNKKLDMIPESAGSDYEAQPENNDRKSESSGSKEIANRFAIDPEMYSVYSSQKDFYSDKDTWNEYSKKAKQYDGTVSAYALYLADTQYGGDVKRAQKGFSDYQATYKQIEDSLHTENPNMDSSESYDKAGDLIKAAASEFKSNDPQSYADIESKKKSSSNTKTLASQASKVKSMSNSGMTTEEIAKKMGVPVGSISSILYGDN